MKDSITLLSYIPHGFDENTWHKFTAPDELAKVTEMKKQLFGPTWEQVQFVVLYNGRNIQRKRTTDVIMAYREFLLSLPKDQQDTCRLILKTDPRDPAGTDLPYVIKHYAPEINVVFVADRLAMEGMVCLYNCTDVLINMSEAEGLGIPVQESMLCEKMCIQNITGGLQDTAGSQTKNGEYLHPDKHYTKTFLTNADKGYPDVGEWCIPLWPVSRAYIGSLETPMIHSSRCSIPDATTALRQVYDMPLEERARRGALGREYALRYESGMTTHHLAERMVDNIEELFATFEPRKPFALHKV